MTSNELVLVLLSAALHAAWSATIKRSGDPVLFNWLQLAAAGLVGLVLVAGLPSVHELGAPFLAIASAAAVCHGLYVYWLGRALEAGDLSLVYPIARSTPAVMPFLAVPLLGERISVWGAFGIATVVLGMWLVQTNGRFTRAALAPPGALFAWLTLLATVGYGLTDKSAMNLLEGSSWEEPVPRSVFYFFVTSLGGWIVLTPFAMRRGRRRLAEVARLEGIRALGAITVSFASYTLILEALRSAQVSYVVAVRQSSVLFAVLLSSLWLRERSTPARVTGALVIVFGVALVSAFG